MGSRAEDLPLKRVEEAGEAALGWLSAQYVAPDDGRERPVKGGHGDASGGEGKRNS